MPARPGYNKSGMEVAVVINAFRVTKLPTMKVYQWDVGVADELKMIQLG